MDISVVEAIWFIPFRYVNEYVLWPPNRTHRVKNTDHFDVNRLLAVLQPRVSFAFPNPDGCVVLVAFGNDDHILFCQILRRLCGNVEVKLAPRGLL